MSQKFSKRWEEKKAEQRRIKRKNIKKMMKEMLKEIEYKREKDGLADLDETSYDDGQNFFCRA